MNAPRGIDWIEARLDALREAIARQRARHNGELVHRLEVERDQLLRARRRTLPGVAW